MTHQFPIFDSHGEASCFNCGGDFGHAYPFKSGYPVGQWVQDCAKCRMATHYDVREDETAAAGRRENLAEMLLDGRE